MRHQDALDRVWTVPNMLSAVRLALAILFFVLIDRAEHASALAIFLVAASTDWVDGWWARRFGQVSRLGRIFDPLVDKVIVCGGFILLASAEAGPAIRPWMAVVVVVRELVVTAIRAEMERTGRDFSAAFSGKIKMLVQCAAIALELFARVTPGTAVAGVGVQTLATAASWAAVTATIWSGLQYLIVARGMLVERESSPPRR